MFRSARAITLILFVVSIFALVGWQATDSKLDDAALKSTLTGLGYEVKEVGTNTFEIGITAQGLNIPTRVFLSKSQTKVWMSVALMTKEGVDKLTRDDLKTLLEKNVEVGPCHFMLDGGWLKMKMAIDNRAITPAVMRTELDYLTARVGETKSVWQK